jgi:hypothetical protein
VHGNVFSDHEAYCHLKLTAGVKSPVKNNKSSRYAWHACAPLQASIKTVGEAVSRLVGSHGRVPTLDPKEDMKVR